MTIWGELRSEPESGERSKRAKRFRADPEISEGRILQANVSGERGPARKWIALAALALLAGLAWATIDPGKIRLVVLLLLAVFALRIVLTASSSR